MTSLKRGVSGATLFAIILGCGGGASSGVSQADLSQADKDAVKAQIDQYRRASLAQDWDAWGNTLDPDVIVSPPNMQPLNGRAAAVAWGKAFPRITGFTVNVEEVSGHGDLAYDRGTYELKMTMPDGSPASDRGTFLEVHRRSPNGTWPYTRLMFHSTEPLPAASPPKQS
jgi:ketosteroid isomerase-like protein